MIITIKDNLPDVQRYIDRLGKQARYAAMLALNETVFEVRQAERKAIQQAFDRPTPYTLNSVLYKKATKTQLTARVYLRDDPGATPADRFLNPQIEGGARTLKRFEKLLQSHGKMPGGTLAMPGRAGARIDRYGNMSHGQLIQILSQLKVTGSAGYTRNISAASKKRGALKRAGGQYFALTSAHGTLQPGVYLRKGRGIKPTLVYVKQASYKKRLDFYGVGERTVREVFQPRFYRALERALATAR